MRCGKCATSIKRQKTLTTESNTKGNKATDTTTLGKGECWLRGCPAANKVKIKLAYFFFYFPTVCCPAKVSVSAVVTSPTLSFVLLLSSISFTRWMSVSLALLSQIKMAENFPLFFFLATRIYACLSKCRVITRLRLQFQFQVLLHLGLRLDLWSLESKG